jgi:hypothetical protein
MKKDSKNTGIPKPVTSKTSVSKSNKRKYKCGGKLKK